MEDLNQTIIINRRAISIAINWTLGIILLVYDSSLFKYLYLETKRFGDESLLVHFVCWSFLGSALFVLTNITRCRWLQLILNKDGLTFYHRLKERTINWHDIRFIDPSFISLGKGQRTKTTAITLKSGEQIHIPDELTVKRFDLVDLLIQKCREFGGNAIAQDVDAYHFSGFDMIVMALPAGIFLIILGLFALFRDDIHTDKSTFHRHYEINLNNGER